MSSRRAVRTLAIAAITGLGITALAAPAHANDTLVLTYSSGDPASATSWSLSQDTANGTGFTFRVENVPTCGSSPCEVELVAPNTATLENSQGDTCSNNSSDQCKVGSTPEDLTIQASVASATINVYLVGYGGQPLAMFTVSSDAPPNPDPQPSNAEIGSTPGAYIQQFGVPATGTCDEAAPEGLNWGGASSGGWGESWAQWANDGNGGDVCTRTLGYNNSTGMWQVQ